MTYPYILRRLLQSIIVLVLVSMIVFVLMRLLPGDPILIYVTQGNLESSTQEQIDLLRKEFGLDKSMPAQYVNWIARVIRGDLGKSILHRDSVSGEIARRLPITFFLGMLAFVISILIGIPAGIISATRRGRWLDTAVTTLANIGITVPIFWLGILLIYFFALYLGWLPVFGYTSPFEDFWLSIKQVIMPVVCLSVFAIASNARQARSSMLEVIRQDYIRTAWSKGLRERSVILGHALKNALIPVVTLIGMMVRNIFGGSVLIETVFNIPGMGRLAVEGILGKDYQVVQGCVLITALIVLASNLVVDISYGWLDPRIRYK